MHACTLHVNTNSLVGCSKLVREGVYVIRVYLVYINWGLFGVIMFVGCHLHRVQVQITLGSITCKYNWVFGER